MTTTGTPRIARRTGAALAAALPLVAAACGQADDTAGPLTTLPVIAVGAADAASLAAPESADAAAGAATDAAPDRMIAPMVRLVFEPAPGLPALDAPATVYRMDTTGIDVPARVAAWAARLGVPGEVRALPAEEGGGWQVGSNDGTGPSIWVGGTGVLDIGYSANIVREGWACAGSEDGTDVDCPEPEPPAGVPSAEEARTAAEALFTELGLDLSDVEVEVSADEWGAWVNAVLVVDGTRTGLSWSASYGGEGVLEYLGGFLATPVVVGQYPLAGTAAGVVRLQEQHDRWSAMPIEPLDGVVARGDTPVSDDEAVAEEVPAEEPDATTVAPDETLPATLPPDDVPTETVVVDPPVVPTETVVDPTVVPIETVPEPGVPGTTTPMPVEPPVTAPAETQPVRLSGVTMALQVVWDVDGVVWLVPAYAFTADDGGLWEVLAVADGLLDLTQADVAVPMPEPAVAVAEG